MSLQGGDYLLGNRFTPGVNLRLPRLPSFAVSMGDRYVVTTVLRPFWHGRGTPEYRYRGERYVRPSIETVGKRAPTPLMALGSVAVTVMGDGQLRGDFWVYLIGSILLLQA